MNTSRPVLDEDTLRALWGPMTPDQRHALVRAHLLDLLPALARDARDLGVAPLSQTPDQDWVEAWAPSMVQAVAATRDRPSAWADLAEGLKQLQDGLWLWLGQGLQGQHPVTPEAQQRVIHLNGFTLTWSGTEAWADSPEAALDLPSLPWVQEALFLTWRRQRAHADGQRLDASLPRNSAASSPPVRL